MLSEIAPNGLKLGQSVCSVTRVIGKHRHEGSWRGDERPKAFGFHDFTNLVALHRGRLFLQLQFHELVDAEPLESPSKTG
jgi:hypothetical protein